MNIGWCVNTDEHSIIFNDPIRAIPKKDDSISKRGYLSCPSVRSFLDNKFYISSPYSLQLRFIEHPERFEIYPIYPFTSINENILKNYLFVEHHSSWRDKFLITIQMPSPYIFFTDDLVYLEQSHPLLLDQSKINWRTIPGKFDIYSWQRPLNWAFEWDTRLGDLIIKSGDPLYTLSFYNSNNSLIDNVNLKKYKTTPELKERISLSHGITKVKKGINPLIEKSKKERKKIKLLK